MFLINFAFILAIKIDKSPSYLTSYFPSLVYMYCNDNMIWRM